MLRKIKPNRSAKECLAAVQHSCRFKQVYREHRRTEIIQSLADERELVRSMSETQAEWLQDGIARLRQQWQNDIDRMCQHIERLEAELRKYDEEGEDIVI